MNEHAPHPTRDSVGWFVRKIRKDLGLTQEQLARQIGTSREYLSQIEGGRPKWPQRYIVDIARELGVSQYELALAAGKISELPTDHQSEQEWFTQSHPGDRFASFLGQVVFSKWINQQVRDGIPTRFRDAASMTDEQIDDVLNKLGVEAEFEVSADPDDPDRKTFSITLNTVSQGILRLVEEVDPALISLIPPLDEQVSE